MNDEIWYSDKMDDFMREHFFWFALTIAEKIVMGAEDVKYIAMEKENVKYYEDKAIKILKRYPHLKDKYPRLSSLMTD